MAQLIPVDVFDLIIFGGTGDLAMRKLLPALYHRDRAEQVTGSSRIIAGGRSELSRKAYLETVEAALRANLADGEFDPAFWKAFSTRIEYVQADAESPSEWSDLVKLLNGNAERTRVYLSGDSTESVRPDRKRPEEQQADHRQEPHRARETGRPRFRVRASDINDRRRQVLCRKPDLSYRSLSRQGNRAEPAGAAFRQLAVRAAVASRQRSIMCRLRSPRISVSAIASSSTTGSARCATWCRTICCSSCA